MLDDFLTEEDSEEFRDGYQGNGGHVQKSNKKAKKSAQPKLDRGAAMSGCGRTRPTNNQLLVGGGAVRPTQPPPSSRKKNLAGLILSSSILISFTFH